MRLDDDDVVVVWLDRITYFLAGMIFVGVLALIAIHGG